jgi:DNA-binding NarL/FixJ family response regulator
LTRSSIAGENAATMSLTDLGRALTASDNQASLAETEELMKSSPFIGVAVVEDNRRVRDNLAAQINRSPRFRCVSRHGTGEEALRILPSTRPDVVLMDINLPGMSGIECIRRLRERLPEANILMLTVYEEGEKIFESLKAGANGYLLKGISARELLEAIAQVHAGGSPMTGLIARKVVQFFKRLGRASEQVEGLSPREREILERLGGGAASKEIADALGLSVHTVRMHIRGIYRKLHVHSRSEVVAKYMGP